MKSRNHIEFMKRYCLIWLLFSISILGCMIKKVSYDKSKIEKKYAGDYQITIDGLEVDFSEYYLNKNNIKSVTRNIKERRIDILQKEDVNYIGYGDIESEQLPEKINLLIVDGVIHGETSKLKIDHNAIESITVLLSDSLNTTWMSPNRRVVLVVTK